MNKPHKDARTTQLGRAEMVKRTVDDGQPVAVVAKGFGVSERTARKCVERFKASSLSASGRNLMNLAVQKLEKNLGVQFQ